MRVKIKGRMIPGVKRLGDCRKARLVLDWDPFAIRIEATKQLSIQRPELQDICMSFETCSSTHVVCNHGDWNDRISWFDVLGAANANITKSYKESRWTFS